MTLQLYRRTPTLTGLTLTVTLRSTLTSAPLPGLISALPEPGLEVLQKMRGRVGVWGVGFLSSETPLPQISLC